MNWAVVAHIDGTDPSLIREISRYAKPYYESNEEPGPCRLCHYCSHRHRAPCCGICLIDPDGHSQGEGTLQGPHTAVHTHDC